MQYKYMKKEITELDREQMRQSLVLASPRLGPEPHCDFCGSERPVFLYAAVKLSTGEWMRNWRWCACSICSAAIDRHDWDVVHARIFEWLTSQFKHLPVPEEFLWQSAMRAMNEFHVYVVRILDEGNSGH
jgi:hypothetical protein